MCRLCARASEGRTVCLKCRAGAIKADELKATKTAPRVSLRIRKRWIVLPAAMVVAFALLSAIAIPLLADSTLSNDERRAADLLRAVAGAEEKFRVGHARYATLEELVSTSLLDEVATPGYDVRVDVARDGRTFWCRAVPREPGLRSLTIDVRRELQYGDR